MKYANLGEFVKDVRLNKAMTQREFVDFLGCMCVPLLSLTEKGVHKVSLRTLKRLAVVTGKPTEWLRDLNERQG